MRVVLGVACFAIVVGLLGVAPPSTRAQSGTLVTYAAGWNLVAGPEGTVFTGATGTLYTLQRGDAAYRTSAAAIPVHAGFGYWAYFPQASVVRLAGSPSLPLSIQLPARQFVLIGDPAAEPVAVSPGADLLATYDPSTRSYTSQTALLPGQGAWAYSETAVILTISALVPPGLPPTPATVITSTPTATVAANPPAAPQAVRAVALDATRIRLDWQPSVGATGYVLLDATDRHQIAVLPQDAITFTLVGLVPDSQYCVVLYAYNDTGVSPISDQACAQTLPSG